MDHYTVLHSGPGDIVIVAAAQQVQNVCAPHIELSPCIVLTHSAQLVISLIRRGRPQKSGKNDAGGIFLSGSFISWSNFCRGLEIGRIVQLF
jgi:hypothetical protein